MSGREGARIPVLLKIKKKRAEARSRKVGLSSDYFRICLPLVAHEGVTVACYIAARSDIVLFFKPLRKLYRFFTRYLVLGMKGSLDTP